MEKLKENTFTVEPGAFAKKISAALKKMQKQFFVQRFWNKDESLWKAKEKCSALGWIDVVEKMEAALPELEKKCEEIQLAGFKHFVLLGMGGSSMAPMVFQKMTSAPRANDFYILDTVDPDAIRKIESNINISSTLFIVSSKSGSTVEVTSLFDYFYSRIDEKKPGSAGENFIAITDEETSLAKLARNKNFRHTFINFQDIGGRFSALSLFGIVPAVLMGLNAGELLKRAKAMMWECGPEVPTLKNPGIVIGTMLAVVAAKGYNKLTYIFPPELETFGLWLEQLLAESTGKKGKGILPVNGNPMAKVNAYGNDRLFFRMGFSGDDRFSNSILDEFIERKYPVINIAISDEYDLAGEFMRWEIATATAGALMNINPFDQPNVQETKTNTEKILKRISEHKLSAYPEPVLKEDAITYYGVPESENAKLLLENFFSETNPGDYVGILAYFPDELKEKQILSDTAFFLQERLHLPVSIQFGPRYLHSTGQFFKGGANRGFFIIFINKAKEDLNIPNRSYSFGFLKNAQAKGDMEALTRHGKKVLLVDLGADVIPALNFFTSLIEKVTSQILIV